MRDLVFHVVTAAFLLVSVGAQGPVLSELMARNANTFADTDGEYKDWFEVWNKSSSSINLGGYYVTATARGMEVIMMTLGLAVGISIVLSLSLRLGIPVAVGDSLGESRSVVSGMVGSAIIAVGFALASYVRMRLLPIMAIGAALVFAVY